MKRRVDSIDFTAIDLSEIQLIIGDETISLKRIVLSLEAEIEHLNHINEGPSSVEIFRSIHGRFLAQDNTQQHFIEGTIFDVGKPFQLIGNPKGQNAKKAKPFNLKSCVIIGMLPGNWFKFNVNNQSKLL